MGGKRRAKAVDPNAYLPGFTKWACWFIDLSIDAPPIDKQFDALLSEWEKVRATFQPAQEPTA